MDSKKAQEELTEIEKGNKVYLFGNLDDPKGYTQRYEKLINFDATSVTVETPGIGRSSRNEVFEYSKISWISKELPEIPKTLPTLEWPPR